MKHAAEFWARVQISSRPNRCWPWKGEKSLNPRGYPQINWNGKTITGNRLAFTLIHGPIPKWIQILHDCSPSGNNDNPACCNPAHLYAGDEGDNWFDGITRGFNHFRWAERNFNGKITDEQVTWAVSQFGIMRQADIAEALGVSRSHISNIKRGFRRRN